MKLRNLSTFLLAVLLLLSALSAPALAAEEAVLPDPPSVSASVKAGIVTLQWKTVPGADCYQIWRKTGKEAERILASVEGTSYTDRSVSAHQRYSYRLSSMSGEIAGEKSKAVTVEVLPLSGCVICVDPGHGNKKALATVKLAPKSSKKVCGGTVGTKSPYNGTTEAALNLKVSKRLKQSLEAEGATVVMTRTGSACKLNNIQRCQVAQKAGAELTIRIHANGNDNRGVHGIKVLVPDRTYCGKDLVSRSGSAGKLMYKRLLKRTGAKAMGLVKRKDLVGFNWARNPTVLVEMGYMSNKKEDKKLQSASYQKKLVQAMTEGAVDWFAAV